MSSPLIQAVLAGNTADVERQMQNGADPNQADTEGRTALHHAALSGPEDSAAILLQQGADFTLTDQEGKTALDSGTIGLERLHAIRQAYHRLRTLPAGPENDDLNRNGITRLKGLVDPDMLQQLRIEFGAFIASLNVRILRREGIFKRYDDEEHFWPHDRAYVTNNAFKHSPTLVRLCADPRIAGIVRSYLGKPVQITRGVGMRYLPEQAKDRDMYGWHHDLEERRLKIQVLLTDVGPDDQHMSYACGSHVLKHPYPMYLENPCPLDYVREHIGEPDIFNAVGRAGDVFLFDSNGAHRGNRKPGGAIRDAFFVEYSGDTSDVWGGDMSAEVLASLSTDGRDLYHSLLSAEKKWETRRDRALPTWAENLPHVERWVR